MKLPNKKELITEINEMDTEIKEMIIDCYEHAAGNKSIKNPKEVVNKVLKELFKTNFSEEILIPLSFHNTQLAKVLFSILYGIESKIYLMSEVVELTGFSRQYLGQEAKDGNILGTKCKGSWTFEKEEVNRYLSKKGKKLIK